MAKLWRIFPHDPDRVAWLGRAADIPSVVAQLLLSRGVDDPDTARAFLEPKLTGLRDPEDLPGMSAAVERISAAIADGRRIIIYGDYDADGMTASAILLRCFALLGANAGYYVPNRMEEGYGLNHDALDKLAAAGAAQVVTVDCGIASLAEAQHARELGLELIVTDHHALAESLPEAAAIVHPRLPGSAYPFGGLCGAGVALKLAWALCRRAHGEEKVSPSMRSFLLQAVGLAAIGTVADVVPLVDENRVLVLHGLKSLKEQPPPGIFELMKLTEIDKKPTLGSEDIAFSLAPRLNAAGRLGQAQLGVELLTTDKPARAKDLAEYVHELNKSRDSLERSVLRAAGKQATDDFDPHGDPALVLSGVGWHAGVIGIVAGRLSDKHHRPVIVIARDELGVKPATGSGRSVPGFDLSEALSACSELLIGHGGHAAAAGLTISDERIDEFRTAFCECAAENILPEQRQAELHIDAETPLSALTLRAVDQIESLAPFGEGNHRPLLCTTGVVLDGEPKQIGGGGRHLSLILSQNGVRLRGVAFGGGEWADEIAQVEGPLAVAYRPVINHFRGRRSVEMHVVDWRTDGRIVGTATKTTAVQSVS